MRDGVKILLFTVIFGLVAAGSGCGVHSVATYVPTRAFREVHALRTRTYEITPVTGNLHQYKAIEIHRLDNLMLDGIPPQTVAQINEGIVKQVKALNRFQTVTAVDDEKEGGGQSLSLDNRRGGAAASAPTLVLQGFIDDFTAGVPKLRYIEQGNNHAILTIRITLKDKETAGVLGQINITAENSRVTSNVEKMVKKASKEVGQYLRRSAMQPTETGGHTNAQN